MEAAFKKAIRQKRLRKQTNTGTNAGNVNLIPKWSYSYKLSAKEKELESLMFVAARNGDLCKFKQNARELLLFDLRNQSGDKLCSKAKSVKAAIHKMNSCVIEKTPEEKAMVKICFDLIDYFMEFSNREEAKVREVITNAFREKNPVSPYW